MNNKRKTRRDQNLEYLEASQNVSINAAEWLGALVRYAWYLGKRPFNSIYGPNDLWLNVRIGSLLQIVLFIGVIALAVYLMTLV